MEQDQTPVRRTVVPPTGCVDHFNSELRDELLNGEIFHSLREARIVIDGWRRHTNAIRPHSALNRTPPAPKARLTLPLIWPATMPAHHVPANLR